MTLKPTFGVYSSNMNILKVKYSDDQKKKVKKMTDKRSDKSTWVIGGGILIGMGIGFFFLQKSPIAFVASLLLGLGLGLIIAAILSRERR